MIAKKHPQHAHDMLVPIAYLKSALDIPYCHHEVGWNRLPARVEGEQIRWRAHLAVSTCGTRVPTVRERVDGREGSRAHP